MEVELSHVLIAAGVNTEVIDTVDEPSEFNVVL